MPKIPTGICILLSLLASYGLAAPLCNVELQPGQPAPASWQAWQVDEAYMQSGLMLLGRHGERIAPHMAPKITRQQGQLQLAPLAFDQIDWSVYHQRSSTTSPEQDSRHTLYFEPDSQGNPHLCRIEEWHSSEAYQQRQDEAYAKDLPPPQRTEQDWQIVQVQQIRYDAQGHLLTWESQYWDSEQKQWRPGSAQCLRYNATGILVQQRSRYGRSCAENQPADNRIVETVYAADGTLLREILTQPLYSTTVDGDSPELSQIVTRYDAQGNILATYQENEAGRPYRRPHVNAANADGTPGIWAFRNAAELNFRWTVDNNFPVSHSTWRIVSLPIEETEIFDNPRQKILAQGKTDQNGNVRTGTAAQRIWQAMQAPQQLVFLVSTHTFLLRPEVDAQTWRACQDPAQNTAQACP